MLGLQEFRKNTKELEEFLNKKEIILYFKFKNEVFCCSEEGRIIFSKLKTNDEEIKNYKKDIKFNAFNLSKSTLENSIERSFNFKDLNNIEIINKEKIYKLLRK